MVLSSDVLTSLVSLFSTSSTNIGMTFTKIINMMNHSYEEEEVENILKRLIT
jgi:hypothetical protein